MIQRLNQTLTPKNNNNHNKFNKKYTKSNITFNNEKQDPYNLIIIK